MATRVSENPEVEAHYATQVALTAGLFAALRRLWPVVNPLTGPAAEARYRDGVAAVVDQFSLASISLSADYYEDMRAGADIDTPFRFEIIDPPARDLIDASIDWALSAQADIDEIEAAIQGRIEAASQKAVADAGRSQVMGAIAGDERALGFARIAQASGCAFCLTLAMRRDGEGRLGVYKSRETAGQLPPNTTSEVNRYHNNCHCQVIPIFEPGYELEPHLAELDALYDESTANSKRGERLNDFRRALTAMRSGADAPTSTPRDSGAPVADRLAALQNILDGFGN